MAVVGTGIVEAAAAAEAAAGVTTGNAWAARGTGSDGDWQEITADNNQQPGVYRYSTTIGEWVRPWVYGGTPVLDARIVGDVVPSDVSNTPNPWVDGGTSPGTMITTDGTKVTWDSSASNAHIAYSGYTHAVAGVNSFMVGLCEVITSGAAPSTLCRSWYMYGPTTNGVSDVLGVCLLDDNTGKVTAYGPAGMEISDEDLTSGERYLEVYFSASSTVFGDTCCVVYVGNSAIPCAALRQSAASSSVVDGQYTVGDVTGSASGKWTVRELFAGRW